jgi:hypothetical protein
MWVENYLHISFLVVRLRICAYIHNRLKLLDTVQGGQQESRNTRTNAGGPADLHKKSLLNHEYEKQNHTRHVHASG